MKFVFIVTLAFIALISCESFSPEESLGEVNALHLVFEGPIWTEGGYQASFSLVNDSTASIQYFGYSEDYPLYNSQALSDTGWTNLMWGWCGTGATYYTLESGSSISFQSMLPNEACTWRLLLDITDVSNESYQRIYSENIIYTGVPTN